MWTPSADMIVTAEQKQEKQRSELQSQFSSAIQQHLDNVAKERRYDSIQSAISYRGDGNAKFAAEADAAFAWRSAVWTYATAELDKVMSGQRDIPTVEDFMNELPTIDWNNYDEA